LQVNVREVHAFASSVASLISFARAQHMGSTVVFSRCKSHVRHPSLAAQTAAALTARGAAELTARGAADPACEPA
jgi:hypothetical protein